MWAVSESHHEIVRMLLGRGAEPRAFTADGFTPLLLAAADGDLAMAETFLAAGVDVNETGADGTHVLPYAIVNSQDAFALFLLEHGADPNGSMGGVSAPHAAAGSVGSWLHDWSRRHGEDPSYRRGGIGRVARLCRPAHGPSWGGPGLIRALILPWPMPGVASSGMAVQPASKSRLSGRLPTPSKCRTGTRTSSPD